jgi:bifunctional non-homologous end joining protein LigD
MATRKAATRKPAKKAATKPKQTSASDAVDEQLARYRSMRDFSVTAEPSGTRNKNAKRTKRPKGLAARDQGAVAVDLPFCIQKHAASHLHYDFRLGWNGVLKSWACAKGPSLNVKDRRLAIQVEDHPIEYGGFEGIIPAGQYGGGTVMLWDQGAWEPQAESADVDKALADGHLKFLLHGTKLQGKWALIRMAPRPKETKPSWLLIKEHDDFERPPDAPAITEEAPDSVITGRSIEQIAANEDHIWNSNRPEKPTGDRVPHPRGARVGSPAPNPTPRPDLDLTKLPTELQPTFLKPQLAQETESPPEGPAWLHELKLDGYRMQGRKDGTKVQLLTRSGLDWTARMKSIADEIATLPVDSVTLDGEVVVLAPDGTTNFADLQAAFQENAKNPLTYFCFDLLHVNGHDPRNLPLIERKKLLAEILKSANSDHLQYSEHIVSNGLQMFHKACEFGAEGIVSKRADAAYSGSRSAAWLKSKCLHEQEFVIGGFTLPGKGKAGGPGIGALLLGYYDDSGKNLIYAGRTGTGFTQKFAAELRKRLEAIKRSSSPFQTVTADARKGAIWVSPTLVAQVRFATWTADTQVRQAAFLGLREDKPPAEIRRETAAPTPKSAKQPQNRVPHPHGARVGESATESQAKPSTAKIPDHPPVRLTHPLKILDNQTQLTKQQLADYYWAVAARMLPHIADRPLSLVRCPEGSEKPCFFQKHVNAMLPPGIGSVDVADKKGVVEPYITLKTPEALAGLAQLGVLEVHPWGSRNETLEQPDRITIDLDPDETLPWETLTDAALDVRKRLKALKLESWVKTTGGKGLHVVIPIAPEQQWPAVKEWAHQFVLGMERDNPRLYLTKMTKAARAGKIYLDYLRNERGATAVAPYSPRARKGAPVSVPLAWSELKSPRPDFHVSNFPEWSHRLKKDVWSALLSSSQRLSPRLTKSKI